ncbi:hypothetical protein D8S82_05555 [Mycobacterium hodleri]|uniref:Uncharacterized protein n=1 Tax=Mycolicibacterium hodleri TaxID=49897 RepID=A0A544W606_9MYCO|nr:hypothetical protein [Mycolicibacterium hodleri]TQR87661.1 hypothetical protein D8S82_05555 [Mycolicibacterium hodleri]
MNFTQYYSGVAIANAVVTSSPLAVAGPATHAERPMTAMHGAIPAYKRRAAAATVASVNRGTT